MQFTDTAASRGGRARDCGGDGASAPARGDELRPATGEAASPAIGSHDDARPEIAPRAFAGMASRSALVHELFDRVADLADADSTVLLVGEPGTGKELVARALHTEGKRRHARLATVTCADPPAALLDGALLADELPGAAPPEAARGLAALSAGTLLLDHVESTPLDVQARMLRLLEDAPLPLGRGARSLAGVRIVAISNVDLEELVASGAMRADFFHRVAVVPLRVPPLRERSEDIALLAPEMLARSSLASVRDVERVADDALAMLVDHPWPGNLRELGAVLERAALVATDGEIRAADLAAWWRGRPASGVAR